MDTQFACLGYSSELSLYDEICLGWIIIIVVSSVIVLYNMFGMFYSNFLMKPPAKQIVPSPSCCTKVSIYSKSRIAKLGEILIFCRENGNGETQHV